MVAITYRGGKLRGRSYISQNTCMLPLRYPIAEAITAAALEPLQIPERLAHLNDATDR